MLGASRYREASQLRIETGFKKQLPLEHEYMRTFTDYEREFGGANNETCRLAINGLLDHLQANDDVWAGWLWWAAGPWWGDYMYSIEPAGSADKPQMSWLQPYLP